MPKMRWSRSTVVTNISVTAILFLVVLDQVSKYLAISWLEPWKPVIIVPDVLHLNLVFNQGAAFGIMRNMPNPWRMAVFSIMYVVAFFILLNIYRQRPQDSRMVPVSIVLISGGAIGNMIDRYRYGYVIDFIDTFPFGYHFPTFNVADSSITTGVAIMIIHLLFFDRTSRHES